MSIESACVSVAGVLAESLTCTVKLAVAAGPAGVPEITPAELRDRPSGRAPALTLNVFVPWPPVAVTVSLYAAPITPSFTVVEVMLSGPPPPSPLPPPPQATSTPQAARPSR